MERIHHNYKLWEDYKAGMYDTEKLKDEKILIDKAKLLLSNKELFFKFGLEMVLKWKYSAEENLSNSNSNRLSSFSNSFLKSL